jgi:hypothetical protein
MFLIESHTQLQQLVDSNIQIKLLFPVWSSNTEHELDTTISFIYCLTTDNTPYIINLNHIDAEKCPAVDIAALTNEGTYAYGIRYLKCNGVDYEWAYFEEYAEPFVFSEFFTELYQQYNKSITDVNDCIPIMKWLEKLNTLKIPSVIRDSDIQYTKGIITLGEIEGAGVNVNSKIFTSQYIRNGINRTKYNPYTITGRPSNRHAGINWAALPKEGAQRTGVIPRRPDGMLMAMDFESYHLRIIARMAGYTFPNGIAAHKHLAEWYGVDVETAKGITFKWLYGGIPEAGLTIPFFASVSEWMERIWMEFTISGEITTPIFRRKIRFNRIESPTKEKVINYLIQATETEINFKKLETIIRWLSGRRSRLILYTYDAVLIDCPADELEDVGLGISQIMEAGGFPVRIYTGPNYGVLS